MLISVATISTNLYLSIYLYLLYLNAFDSFFPYLSILILRKNFFTFKLCHILRCFKKFFDELSARSLIFREFFFEVKLSLSVYLFFLIYLLSTYLHCIFKCGLYYFVVFKLFQRNNLNVYQKNFERLSYIVYCNG